MQRGNSKRRQRDPRYDGRGQPWNNKKHYHSNQDSYHQDTKRQRRDERGPGGQHRSKSGSRNDPIPIKSDGNNQQVKIEPKIEDPLPKTEDSSSLSPPIPDIDFASKGSGDDADRGCVYISNLPLGASKHDLARFINQQYVVYQGCSAMIVACTLREDKRDAFVEFEEESHQRDATHVLGGRDFGGSYLEVKDDDSYKWQQFTVLASRKAQQEARLKAEQEEQAKVKKVEEEKGEVSVAEDLSSSQLMYFGKKINVAKCIYVYGLPDDFGAKDLMEFMISECDKKRGITVKVTACHFRSQTKDACIEVESNRRLIIEILKDAVIRETHFIEVKEWRTKMTKTFLEYYRKKEERKKQKLNQKEQEALKEAGKTPEISIDEKSPNESKLKEEINRLKEEMKLLKEERDRYHENFVKVTKAQQILKYKHNEVVEAKKELEQKLNRVEEEADTLQFNLKEELKEMKETDAEQKTMIDKQKILIGEQKKQFEELTDKNEDLQAKFGKISNAHSNLQTRFAKKETENFNLNQRVRQSQQEVTSAREERDDAREAEQDVRERSRHEQNKQTVHVKQEWNVAELEKGDMKKDVRKMKKEIESLIEKLKESELQEGELKKIIRNQHKSIESYKQELFKLGKAPASVEVKKEPAR